MWYIMWHFISWLSRKRVFLVWWLVALSVICAGAQITDSLDSELNDLMEQAAESVETEGLERTEWLEILESYRRQPLDLNRASANELASLVVLNDLQIRQLIRYRERLGPLISIYELQAVPGFDVETIRRIRPLVTVTSDYRDFHLSRHDLFAKGRHSLLARWKRAISLSKGYLPRSDSVGPVYRGSPDGFYVRYRYVYTNKMSFGLTAEKDAGEPFFSGPNRAGFDFYSGHFFVTGLHPVVQTVALGDYQLNLGQGLIYYSGFAPGKSALVTGIRRSAPVLRPFASVREFQFLRGAATTIRLRPGWTVTGFVSRRRNDASPVEPDTTDRATRPAVSGLIRSGLHRTESELRNKNRLRADLGGLSLHHTARLWEVGIQTVYERFSQPIRRRPKPYNRFLFAGDRLWNTSVDYAVNLPGVFLFGESAVDRAGTTAHVAGMLSALTPQADLAVLFRHFPKSYQTLHAAPFAESSGAVNETGLYLGLQLRPSRPWLIAVYQDIWRHPWLRFGATAPSDGAESLVRVRYKLRRNLEVYAQWRQEIKFADLRSVAVAVRPLGARILRRYRIHLAKRTARGVEWRTRAEWSFVRTPDGDRERGFLLYQDLIFKPWERALSLTARVAYFHTDSYASGIYAYENDLLHTFTIPVYYRVGVRTYINLRYRPVPAWTWEARLALTRLYDRDDFGSGNDRIEAPFRRDFAVQVRYLF